MLTKLKFQNCLPAIILKLILLSFAFFFITFQIWAQDLSIRYLGNHPDALEKNWTKNFQGISNSGNYWYFNTRTRIWKVPLSENLNQNFDDNDSSIQVDIPDELKNLGFDRLGDPDNMDGYLFIPIYMRSKMWANPAFLRPAIAVFDENNLNYISYFEIEGIDLFNLPMEWCAINPITKDLYTSRMEVGSGSSLPILVYEIDWEKLKEDKELVLTEKNPFQLNKRILSPLQGGDFSTDGCYMFFTNGKDGENESGKGIQVYQNINNKSGEFIMASAQSGDFRFQFETNSIVNEEFVCARLCN